MSYRRYVPNNVRHYASRFRGGLRRRWQTHPRRTAGGLGCLVLLLVLVCLGLPCAACLWLLNTGYSLGGSSALLLLVA